MNLYTSRTSYLGVDRLDIARTGRDPFGIHFAPSKDLLDWALDQGRSEATWAAYAPAYVQEMRLLYRYNRQAFTDLAARSPVVLVCFCEDVTRCHRGLIAGILVKLGWSYRGELTPRPCVETVLGRRRQGWADHRTYSWMMRKGDVFDCLHCGIRGSVEAPFVEAHRGCCYKLEEVA